MSAIPPLTDLNQKRFERPDILKRLTATRYLDTLAAGGFLLKRRFGRSNYYINLPLYGILTGESTPPGNT